ncbi:MAG TPA: hypothetical protein VFU21_09670 [Kofleriaceae bacterium]|nr:hypothetical protein [Kofleriaceae bacterium]
MSGAPATAQAARAAAEEIESAWSRAPLVAGLTGDDVAGRTAFLDYLAGARLFHPVGRSGAVAVVRLRRGDETRFRAVHDDGTVEELTLSGPETSSIRARTAELRARQDEIRAELSARESALERARLAVPAPLQRRPPVWAFWGWIARWVLGLFSRKRLAAEASAAEQVGYVRAELASLEREAEEMRGRAQKLDATFVNRLRAAVSGGGGSVATVELTVVGGPLPEGVEVVDPARAGETDALLTVSGEEVILSPADRDMAPRRLGDFRQALAALPFLLESERALALGRRARYRIVVGADTLERAIERAEAGFRARIERLEALRMGAREPFIARQLERMRPLVTERIHMTLEQATVHLGMEVERLGAGWARAISQAESGDDLRAAADAIDKGSPADLQGLAKEVRLLVAIGLNGATHDLFPELVAELRKLGLPPEVASPPKLELPPPEAVEVCPSLAAGLADRVLGSAQWLSALFRSLDARRSDALERIEQRRHRLRDVAMSELLNSEPQLASALSAALGLALAAALDRYDQWVEAALQNEHEAIARDRDALSPLMQVREGARRDDARLADLMAQLEAELPALAG